MFKNMTLKKLLDYVFKEAKGHTEKTFSREEIGRWLSDNIRLDSEVSELLRGTVEVRVLRMLSGVSNNSEEALNPMADEANVFNYRVHLLGKFPELFNINAYLDLEIVFKKTKGVWSSYHAFSHTSHSELDEIDLERPLVDYVNEVINRYKYTRKNFDSMINMEKEWKSMLNRLSINDIRDIQNTLVAITQIKGSFGLFMKVAQDVKEDKRSKGEVELSGSR